jgi:hypothetical protein
MWLQIGFFPDAGNQVLAHLHHRRHLAQRPMMELGPLNAMGRSQWFANFPRAGDDCVIKSGSESNWVTVAP